MFHSLFRALKGLTVKMRLRLGFFSDANPLNNLPEVNPKVRMQLK